MEEEEEEGRIKCHLKRRLRCWIWRRWGKAYELIEGGEGGVVEEVGLGVDFEGEAGKGGGGEVFA